MGRLKLPYLPTSADVVAGDLLVTSGLGGGFPAGYPVGMVAEVKRDPAQSLADVDVKPAAALDRSRELMFVWLQAQPTQPPPPRPPIALPKPAISPPPLPKAQTAGQTPAPTSSSSSTPTPTPTPTPAPTPTPTPTPGANDQ
jgi:rod shape-determining protein MreC